MRLVCLVNNNIDFFVLGSNGMLGHIVSDYLRMMHFIVIGLAKTKRIETDIEIDFTNFNDLSVLVKQYNPAVIVNCVGILNQDVDQSLYSSIRLNSLLPHFLVDITKNMNTKVIQISTDCVFSGVNGPYAIDDLSDAFDYYGKTKFLGEINNNKDLTIRTSIVGPDLKSHGKGLFNWFSNQITSVDGFSEVIWSGVTTLQLAKFIHFIFNNNMTGLIQYTNNKEISKFELLKLFNLYRKNPVQIVSKSTKKVNKALINQRDLGNHRVPPYDMMVKEMMDWIDYNIESYPHYKEV
jgi:dTDP-4-dehydrorhamnose reductase